MKTNHIPQNETPADSAERLGMAERRIIALLNELKFFAMDSMDEHFDNFKTDAGYISACVDMLFDLKEQKEEDERMEKSLEETYRDEDEGKDR